MRDDPIGLPGGLRAVVETRTGSIRGSVPAPSGNHADIAATLDTASGPVFIKAARKLADKDGPEVRSLRREAAINPYVREYAPRLQWQVETGEWLALGFDYVQGRSADFAPGSSDLAVLAELVHALQATVCPDVVGLRVERRWAEVADDLGPMAGNSLLHTDLNEGNILITAEGRAYLVDWAFVSRGAAWLELGLLIPWLLKAGHRPADAEAWISRFPSWAQADDVDKDNWSRAFADLWQERSARFPSAWAAELAELSRTWADYRKG